MHGGKHGRRYYLSDVPLDEAVDRFNAALGQVGAPALMPSENVSLEAALGRTTAEPVWARISSPHYDSAAMDGVAVRAADTVGATETAPLTLHVGEQAQWVDTGDPLPQQFDAVVMVEEVHEVDGSTIEIQSPVAPYQHVRPLGEDIVAAELVLPESHRLRPVDLGACAAAGLSPGSRPASSEGGGHPDPGTSSYPQAACCGPATSWSPTPSSSREWSPNGARSPPGAAGRGRLR